MIKHTLHTILLLLCTVAVQAQSIRVQVQNRNNAETVPFAYIHVLSATGNALNTVQTDESGWASFAPEQFPVTIEVNALGFEVAKKTFATYPNNPIVTIYISKRFSALDEVVVTGLNKPVKQRDALSVYKIITKEQIAAQGAVTLDEVMKNQLNVRVANDNILGTSMRMQGQSGDKVKILIDGIPINGREGGSINLSQINMNNVDRIELIQGPMSVVYGTDAIGGIINIITKTEKKPFSINLGAQYETLGKTNADISISKQIAKRHHVTVGGGGNFFTGWNEIEQVKTYNDDTLLFARSFLFKPKEQYLGNGAYVYTAPSGFKAQIASDYMQEEVTNKGNLNTWDPYNGAQATDEYYNTTRSMNRLSLNGKLGKKGTWQSQNGYMVYYRTRSSYIKDMVSLERELSTLAGAQDTSTFKDVFARASYSNSIGKLDYIVGYDINLQHAYSLKINGGKKNIQDYAAYLKLSYQLIKDKLVAQGGVRGSYNTHYNPPAVPNINLLYTPTKKLQLRASYTQGYRAPSLKEMYLSFIDLNHYIIGNENLQAESSKHAQVSASYQVYEDKTDYLQFVLTGYYNDVSNGITLAPLDPDNPTSIKYTYANLSNQKNTIISLTTDGKYSNVYYQLGVSRNFTFASPNNYASFSASEATATLQYDWKQPGVNFNVAYKLSGKQPFLQSNIDGTASYNGTQNAFHLCDVSVSRKFFDRKLQVLAGVKNVFDFQQATVSGRVSSGTHGGGVASFLPRSVFTSVRLSID